MYSEPCQTFKMDCFAKAVNYFHEMLHLRCFPGLLVCPCIIVNLNADTLWYRWEKCSPLIINSMGETKINLRLWSKWHPPKNNWYTLFFEVTWIMPQPSSCLNFLRFQASKMLRNCLFHFTKRRGSVLSKVKHFQLEEVLLLFLLVIKTSTHPTTRTENVWL